jgi:peptide deformylase
VIELTQGPDRHLETFDEGCLSLPGGYAESRYGDSIELIGTGQLARCFQHETDHLSGWLMVIGSQAGAAAASTKSRREVADRYPCDWPVSTVGRG